MKLIRDGKRIVEVKLPDGTKGRVFQIGNSATHTTLIYRRINKTPDGHERVSVEEYSVMIPKQEGGSG